MSGRIAVIGIGHVGKEMLKLFPNAIPYDVVLPYRDNREAVMGADLAFVCVPTNELPSGAADISIVTEVVEWLDAKLICIRSTVPPGTIDGLRATTGKRIVFCPEYEGETAWQQAMSDWPYVIVGGMRTDANAVLAYFQERLGPNLSYFASDARTAELVKYMENAWLAMQVTFANEMHEVSLAVGADYNMTRELWALDPRVSRWHTLVFPNNRGFGGKCLPKDLAAIIAAARRGGYEPRFLREIRSSNDRFRSRNKGEENEHA